MATLTKYEFTISASFSSGIASDRFILEIQASNISIALERVDTANGICEVWFKDALGSGDQASLNALVAVHSGVPLPVPGFLADGTPLFAIAQRQSDGVPQVALAPATGAEVVMASHNLCDKCSWFGDSIRVTNELLVDSGDGLLFSSAHPFWIDMVSGRTHNDDGWSLEQQVRNPSSPHGYLVEVKVASVVKEVREYFEETGGDYEVIWETGQVRFFSAPSEAPVVSYSYASGSTFYLRPSAGKILRILKAEADISSDAVMTDTVSYSVFGLVDAIAPELVVANVVPSGTMINVGSAIYKRMGQIAAEAQGAYPIINVLGSTEADRALEINAFRRKSRGTKTPVQALPFNYSTARDLDEAAKLEIRVKLKHDRPFLGDSVTITFYCLSKSSS